MAVIKIPYKDLDQTLKGIHTQVNDSLDYCAKYMPIYNNPKDMYYSLLPMIKYKNDPPGIELLQSVPTLFENNYWKQSGAGDCDCFSILVLSLVSVHKFGPQRIVLCGRSKLAPVHIFTQVYYNKEWITLDLTRRLYNSHKPYKFYQFLDC